MLPSTKDKFMINLIRKAILWKTRFAKKICRYSQDIKMEIHTTKHNMNKIPDPEVKRKSSPVQNHFQKSKYRKKSKKPKSDKMANANENRPYTWFLALPSKYYIILYFWLYIKQCIFGVFLTNMNYNVYCFSIR